MTEHLQQVRASAVQVLHTLPASPAHPCAYLPGQIARDRGFAVHHMEPATWQTMLESGWRRSGMTIYEPACPFCAACRSLRIPVGAFKPDRTLRRLLRRSADLSVSLGPINTEDECFDLYRRYIKRRHDGMMTGSRREFELFLGQSPVETRQLEMRLDGRLVSVGTIDRTPDAWSCVYCYYDPDEPQRSLGTLNVLKSIQWCARHCAAGEESRLYLGYWVHGSQTMAYKARFRPHEVLRGSSRWERVDQFVPWSGTPRVEFGPALRIQDGSVSTGASSS